MTFFELFPAAFLAGVLMFLAPCTLPLVPAYLIFISGVSQDDVDRGGSAVRNRIVRNAVAFVLGFSLIFIVLGVFAAGLGHVLLNLRPILVRGTGLLLVLFGVMMLGARVPFIAGEWHARMPRTLSAGKPGSSFLIGGLFALGWSPCIGPVLGSVLLLASVSSTALSGALLLSVFSLGLSVPFLLSAWFIGSASKTLVSIGRFASALYGIGGVILIALGAAMMFGALGYLAQWASAIFDTGWLLPYL